MANETAKTSTINFVPVQGIFTPDAELVTLIGPAGTPFYAIPDPDQSGLNITNSTINSTTIGATTPSTGHFTSGQVDAVPVNGIDIANRDYVDAVATGLSFKQPATCTTIGNLASLSGLQTVDGVTLVAGNRVLVKDQTASQNNGIYVAAAGTWARSADANSWDEIVSSYLFVEQGTVWAGSAWVNTNQRGGTLGTTPITFIQFSNNATYTAGTGLTLTGFQFSITNTGVTAATKGSASKTVTAAVNAQGQLTSLSDQDIAIAATQITSGTIDTARVSGSYSGITGVGTLGDLTVTNIISGSISGNAATATTAGSATTATTASNLAGGASGSVPYQTASGATTMLAAGSNGQVLTLASGVPSWATPTTGTVTSVSGTGTVSGISLSGTVTSTGSLTLGGTLDLSAPPAIGGTTANTVRGTTVTATTGFVGPYLDAANSAGGALRTATGSACLQWGSGGSPNLTVDVSANINGANAQIDISPTGTGHVHINPTGVNSVQINPTYVGTMDNVTIGATTAVAGTFSTLRINSTLSLAGSTGTSGYVVTSNGASAPTWQALPATGIGIVDDTTTNATRYLTFTSATSGNITTQNTSSTKLQYNPSTGALTATSFVGPASAISSGAANQLVYQTGSSTTSFVAAPTVSSTYLQWTGSAFAWSTVTGGATLATPTTNASYYPTFSDSTSGTFTTANVNTAFTFNPSLKTLSAPQVAATNGLIINSNANTASYTIASGQNAMSVGPFTTASGTSITVPSGSRWVIL
jgi:hypothetical protein